MAGRLSPSKISRGLAFCDSSRRAVRFYQWVQWALGRATGARRGRDSVDAGPPHWGRSEPGGRLGLAGHVRQRRHCWRPSGRVQHSGSRLGFAAADSVEASAGGLRTVHSYKPFGPLCGTPAVCASIMSWDCFVCSGFRKIQIPAPALMSDIGRMNCPRSLRWKASAPRPISLARISVRSTKSFVSNSSTAAFYRTGGMV